MNKKGYPGEREEGLLQGSRRHFVGSKDSCRILEDRRLCNASELYVDDVTHVTLDHSFKAMQIKKYKRA